MLCGVFTPGYRLQAEVSVWVTGDTQGHLTPCQHCPDTVGLGGIARRATMVSEFRDLGQTLLLDVGDFLYGGETAKTRGLVMVEAYNQIGYDAVNVSFRDFRQGLEITREVLEQAEFPLISANIREKAGNLLFPPYILKEFSGKTYAIVGISERPAGMDRLPHLRRQMEGLDVDEPLVAWQRVSEELNGKADTVILLFSGAAGRVGEWLEQYPLDTLRLVVVAGEVLGESGLDQVIIAGTQRHGTRVTQIVFDGEGSVENLEQVDVRPEVEADQQVATIVGTHQEVVRQQEQQQAQQRVEESRAASPVTSSSEAENSSIQVTLLEDPVQAEEQPVLLEEKEASPPQPELTENTDAGKPEPKEPEKEWPEFEPHRGGQRIQADEEGHFAERVEWDIREPLVLEFQRDQLARRELHIHLANVESLEGKVWNLSVRTDQRAFQGAPLYVGLFQPGISGYLMRQTIIGDGQIRRLQGQKDWYLQLTLPSNMDGIPLQVSMAIEEIRDPQDGEVTRPNSQKNHPWNAEDRLSVYGHLDGDETQHIRFVLNEQDELPWRLRVHSSEKAIHTLYLYEESGRSIAAARRSNLGETLTEITDLYPYSGTYVVGVRGSDQDFKLEWKQDRELVREEGIEVPEGAWEQEPNGEISWAHLLKWDEFYVGRLRTGEDQDYYRFYNPGRDLERIKLTIIPATDMALEVRLAGKLWRGEIGETFKDVRSYLPGDHLLNLRSESGSKGFYQVRMERVGSGTGEADEGTLKNFSLKGSLEHKAVAAYWPHHQRVLGIWEISSHADQPVKAEVELISGHAGVVALWREEQESRIEIEIPAGEKVILPVELIMDPDLRDDYPIYIDARLRIEDQGSLVASMELQSQTNQPAIQSHNRLRLPESLAGGLNVAAAYLGAQPLGETPRPHREIEILQGLVRPGGNFVADLHQPFGIKLAGGKPHPIVGVAIHPMYQLSQSRGKWLREFRIETSEDGENWSVALEGELNAWAGEQYFPLEREVQATHIRFTGLSQHQEFREHFGMGSLKVIARPGYLPEELKRIDIAHIHYGGHQVNASPRHTNHYLVGEDNQRPVAVTTRQDHWGENVDWIIGFHHNRMAEIEGVTLDYKTEEGGSQHEIPEKIVVEVAQESPLGPWRQLGEWDLPENLNQPLEIRFEDPVYARFVRFVYPLTWELEKEKTRPRYIRLPQKLNIWEYSGEGSRSILGEWGHYSRKGPYEWKEIIQMDEQSMQDQNPGGRSAGEAVPIYPDEWSQGYVSVGEREAHYLIKVEEGQNQFRVEIQGIPDIAWHYQVTDAEGQPVRVWLEQADDHEGNVLVGQVGPGQYRLRIWEPIRNIAIAWDNSGSMGPYLNPLYASIRTFLTQVDPARERVQLLAFSRNPYFILNEWTGNRSSLLQALLNYHRRDDSSDSEPNLLFISKSMERMEGTKAILLLTDAESGGASYSEQMWSSFEKTRPRIFTLETSSGGSANTQDLMQDWADANHGIYDYMRSAGEVEIAFARANAHLRRPKYYRVKGGGVYVKPPEPGTLQTIAEVPPAGSYYFIFDASGSMMAPIGDQRKFDVARDAVLNLLQQLPDHAQVALRIYGHTKRSTEEGADQDTALEVRMGELNEAHRTLLTTKLERLRPRGRTPLTLSLAQAARDIGGLREVTVVLLTDGGEDTIPRQDPVAEAAKLGAMKNTQLVVVGFDIQREDWSRQLNAIAAAAGAQYLPAPQASDLEPMLRTASGFKPSQFQVLNEEGTVVSEGIFGDKIILPPGRYLVKSGENERPIQIRSESVLNLQPF